MTPWTATVLAWSGAGSPAFRDHKTASESAEGACYWCGHPIGPSERVGRAVPVGWLPSTFPWHDLAAVPSSPIVCEACAWSMSQRAALPVDYARERIARKAEQARREQVAVPGEDEATIRLLLRLDDGRIGLWSKGPNARSEAALVEAAAELRAAPRDVGVCRYLGAWPIEDLTPGTTRMQAFHHFATPDRWWPCTDTDRGAIRAWLLSPPDGPWVGAIGDGKKHALPGALVSGGGLPVVTYQGDAIAYDPDDLAALIAAWEALIVAGASDEEIASGRYARGGLAWTVAWRTHDPILAPHRGGPLLALVSYLRRNRKELADGLPADPGPGAGPPAPPPPAPGAADPDGAEVAGPPGLPGPGGQLCLPGLASP